MDWEELVVYGASLDADNAADTEHAVGLAYSPDMDGWRRLSDHPLSPQASTITWTANRLIAWDYLLNAAAYDPETDSWTALPSPPFPQLECAPDSASIGARVFAAFCWQAALFDVSTQTWTTVNVPPDTISSRQLLALDGAVVYVLPRGLWTFQPR